MRADLARSADLARLADLPAPQHEPGHVRERADEILSQRRFQWSDDSGSNVVDRVVDWIAERFGQLVGQTGGGSLPTFFAWVVLVALVAVVVLLIVRGRRSWRGRGPLAAPGARVVVQPDDAHVDWAAEAERAVAEGRWRDAVRCRYRVLVTDMAAAGWLGDLAGRTTGELAAELRGTRPVAAPAFAAGTELFERTWYGGAPTGPDELAALERHASEARP